jgi:hypothetical protein
MESLYLFGVSMRQAFCILKVLGDVLDDGELHLIETAPNIEVAKARVQVLAEFRAGEYVIYDEATGKTWRKLGATQILGPLS